VLEDLLQILRLARRLRLHHAARARQHQRATGACRDVIGTLLELRRSTSSGVSGVPIAQSWPPCRRDGLATHGLIRLAREREGFAAQRHAFR
jgi:hypothetical protein